MKAVSALRNQFGGHAVKSASPKEFGFWKLSVRS